MGECILEEIFNTRLETDLNPKTKALFCPSITLVEILHFTLSSTGGFLFFFKAFPCTMKLWSLWERWTVFIFISLREDWGAGSEVVCPKKVTQNWFPPKSFPKAFPALSSDILIHNFKKFSYSRSKNTGRSRWKQLVSQLSSLCEAGGHETVGLGALVTARRMWAEMLPPRGAGKLFVHRSCLLVCFVAGTDHAATSSVSVREESWGGAQLPPPPASLACCQHTFTGAVAAVCLATFIQPEYRRLVTMMPGVCWLIYKQAIWGAARVWVLDWAVVDFPEGYQKSNRWKCQLMNSKQLGTVENLTNCFLSLSFGCPIY